MSTVSADLRPAPDFILPTASGTTFHLADHLGMAVIVVVFIRGHWCPYCRRYLCKLQQRAFDIEHAGGKLVVISPEPAFQSARLIEELGLPFPVLSDVDGHAIAAIDRYGTRNSFSQVKSLLPHPAVFVVDLDGMIRHRSIDRNYKKRTTVRTILAAIEEARRA